MAKEQFDVVVIGGGPGGYSAALRAAQRGMRVCLIEEEKLGGVCASTGCIPTKALLHVAELYFSYSQLQKQHLFLGNLTFSYNSILNHVKGIVARAVAGVEVLLQNAGVVVKKGRGILQSPEEVVFFRNEERKDHSDVIFTRKIILATGSLPVKPAWAPVHDDVLCSDDVFKLSGLPQEMVIIGGGYVGLEFAAFFSAFGVKVTIIEMQSRILFSEEEDISHELMRLLQRRGITFLLHAAVEKINSIDGKLVLNYTSEGLSKTISTEKVILALGRKPRFNPEELERLGIKYNAGGIITNDHLQTSLENIYAVGDVNGILPLAHVAIQEGIVAAEHCAGKESTIDYASIPRCVYTFPEVAMIGSRSDQVGRARFLGNGRALASQETEGFVKVYMKDDVLMGGVIIGARASDLIAILASFLGKNYKEHEKIVFAHPTFAEVIRDAILDARKNYCTPKNRGS